MNAREVAATTSLLPNRKRMRTSTCHARSGTNGVRTVLDTVPAHKYPTLLAGFRPVGARAPGFFPACGLQPGFRPTRQQLADVIVGVEAPVWEPSGVVARVCINP